MDTTVYSKLVALIWSIADECLRDVYVRGKYRDVILPMVVLRRLDTLLETTKEKVLEEVEIQRSIEVTDEDTLKKISGYVFYNTSTWTLQKLYNTSTNNPQTLLDNFEDYLNGFSDNVKEIINKLKLKAQIKHMSDKGILLPVIAKFLSPNMNFSPNEKLDPDGKKLPPLTNLGMGYVFEELIRKFNEENNEEAGAHFTPREVIDLMTHIIFMPVKDKLPPIIYIYDPACGSGGMLTEAQNFIQNEAGKINYNCEIHLYGQEKEDETYAICKSDMMIKGNNPDQIKCGSTLAHDIFMGKKFDFMLANPPYGTSWVNDQKYIKADKEVIDNRFKVELTNYWGDTETLDATPRTSDGQLLFTMEMISKMKPVASETPLGSRIASVHNGSSLFTGDAGSGESNIRRFIIEKDYLEAIIQLPTNLFYNTGITTYIWIISNNKPKIRQGKVQLIEASSLYRKLRKNLGDKNCELSQDHINDIVNTYINFVEISKEQDQGIASIIFDNSDFGFYKVNIERPRRLKAQFTSDNIAKLRFDKTLYEAMQWAYQEFADDVYSNLLQYNQAIIKYCEEQKLEYTAKQIKALLDPQIWNKQLQLLTTALALHKAIGEDEYLDFNQFKKIVDKELKTLGVKLSASEKNQLFNAITVYDENAEKVVKQVHKFTAKQLDALLQHLKCPSVGDLTDFGYYAVNDGEYIEYEADSDLRDSEAVPLNDDIQQYFLKEVKPHIGESWINVDSVKIGYEISFNKYFYRHKQLRSIEDVAHDILKLEQESDGLIHEILGLTGDCLVVDKL